jgi:hypothetical protein
LLLILTTLTSSPGLSLFAALQYLLL